MKRKFLVGSQYFFSSYRDFSPKDIDYVRIVDANPDFKFTRQISVVGVCYFDIVDYPKETILDYAINCNTPMILGRFLVPEFSNYFNISIEDLKKLEHLANNLDDNHKYEKAIYDAYIENNNFVLTDSQRDKAYEIYKLYRQVKRNNL